MRGYQKKVIYIKNVGSEMFEEAYFVVKSDTGATVYTHERMVDEANRIIRENFEKKRATHIKALLSTLPAFLLGAVAAAAISIIIWLV